MLEDTFEGMEDDDLEEAAQEEVDKVLFEVTKGNIYVFIFFVSYSITILIISITKFLIAICFPHAYLSHNWRLIK